MQYDGLIFFFLMIAIGYFSVNFRIVSADSVAIVPQLLMNVFYPAMILAAFSQIDLASLTGSGLPVFIATIALTLLLFGLSELLLKRAPQERRMPMQFQAAIGNVAYAAIPLFSVFFGPYAAMIAIVHATAQDILIWSLYYPRFSGSGERTAAALAKRLLTNPCIIALMLGILLKVSGLPLPALQSAIGRIGAVTTPLALFYLGVVIHSYGLLRWRKDHGAIKYTLYKALLLPVFVTIVLLPFLPLQTALLLGILFASPAPVLSILWTRLYGFDEVYAVNCCVASTFAFLMIMSPLCFFLARHGIIM